MKNFEKNRRVHSQGVQKIFRVPIYGAHCAVIFAIAQLSCIRCIVTHIYIVYCSWKRSSNYESCIIERTELSTWGTVATECHWLCMFTQCLEQYKWVLTLIALQTMFNTLIPWLTMVCLLSLLFSNMFNTLIPWLTMVCLLSLYCDSVGQAWLHPWSFNSLPQCRQYSRDR